MKKTFLAVGLLFLALTLAGCSLKKPAAEITPSQAQPTPVPTKPIDQTISRRPYISLIPTSDGHWVDFSVKGIPQGTKGLGYELTYFADIEGSKIERGVTSGDKPMDLEGATEYAKKILFGSASCTTGVCKYKYDENITEGMLTLTLDQEKYESAYRLQSGSEAKEGLTTGDGNFTYTSAVLPARTLYLTISTVGVPVPLPEGASAKSVPYGIFPSVTGKGKVNFETSLAEANIYAYNGKSWQKLPTTVFDGSAVADTSGASLFILTQ